MLCISGVCLQWVLCGLDVFVCMCACMFCVSSVVCARGMHEWLVSHICRVSGFCGTWRSTPGCHWGSPTAALQPALTHCIPLPPARHGCCQGRLQLSWDEAPCWGASQSGCCATGACLQPHWHFSRLKGFCVSHSPSLHSPALRELKPCQGRWWGNIPSVHISGFLLQQHPPYQPRSQRWKCR